MKRKKEEFVIFRPAGKKYYLFYFWRDGKRHVRSTGETSKVAAVDAARRRLATERAGTFEEFTRDFFVWGRCEWIKERHGYGHSFSVTTAWNRRHYLERYLLPVFGPLKLTEITRDKIKKFLLSLDLSNQSRNHLLYTTKTIMQHAEEKGLVPGMNWEGLHFSLSPENRKIRGIFTMDELKMLFPEDLPSVWGDLKHGVCYYILLTCGVRSGEARALAWSKWQRGGLLIDRAVKNDNKTIGPTKTGEARFVPLCSRADRYLSAWRQMTPYPLDDDLIFYGEGRDRPFTQTALSQHFGRRLDDLGIDRRGRVLSPHSLRHQYNTLMKTLLPAAVLQVVTGHKDSKMSEHYDHADLGELEKRAAPARGAIEKLFS